MTTDTRPKKSVVSRGGFTVGGMAKGAGMIHPPSRRCSRSSRPTTRSSRARRMASSSPRSTRASTGSPSTASARRTTPSSCSRTARAGRAHAGDRPRVRAPRSARSAPTSPGRSSPTARARPCCSRSRSAARRPPARREAIARRIATSPLVKTAAFGRDPNWGRVLAAAGSASATAGSRSVDVDRALARIQRRRACSHGGAPTGAERALDGAVCTIELDLGLGDGAASYLAVRPDLRLRPDQRGLHDVSRRARSAASVVGRRRRGALASRRARRRRRPRRRAADLRRDGAARASRSTFVARPPRHDDAALEVVREALLAVNARALRGDRPARARPRRRRDRPAGDAGAGARASSATPLPCRAAGDPRCARGRARSRSSPRSPTGPAERERRRGRGGARRRARRRPHPLRHRRPRRASTARRRAIDGRRGRPAARRGHFEGGIVPKLQAAVQAARLGVRAEIGADGGGRVTSSPRRPRRR